ncbi:hypothetical protein EZV62_021398 [Acer yangbiense]|uniref:Jacalin-type lectin domain-containing protein n=1 Tax=Acer yangbiense TaxID=1000413 RepID=A0A5C7H678_9ROSI|nr:hypothetical protein EZV62_021398 [Acer yangbiense]
MENTSKRAFSDSMEIGPCGGPSGKPWSFKANGAITEIIISYGKVVDSIRFASVDQKNVKVYSKRFGGKGGKPKKVSIDWPGEYLTSIRGTCKKFKEYYVIASLCFYTNRTKYGPFGYAKGSPFVFPNEHGVIEGFYGRAGNGEGFVDAIGVSVKPFEVLSRCSNPALSFATTRLHRRLSKLKLKIRRL